RMEPERAIAAVGEIADQLSMGLEETAEAIVRVAVSGMYLEVSKLVSRHGIDPRELDLIAFGGAGPMMACFLARELGMRRVVIPLTPGVLSAFGGLIADVRNDFIQTLYADLDAKLTTALKAALDDLRRRALAWLHDEQDFKGEPSLICSADIRYRGQSYEIDTPLDAAWIESGDVAAMVDAFHREHARIFDYADTSAPLQLINLRLIVTGVPPKPEIALLETSDAAPVAEAAVPVYYDGTQQSADVYRRAELRAGQSFHGPAIVTQDDTTSCIPGGFAAVVDKFGNLILSRER
ncbi:MAG: hydantoinase/oxoprolinase family protein, partial [Rickettsiales bacterium]